MGIASLRPVACIINSRPRPLPQGPLFSRLPEYPKYGSHVDILRQSSLYGIEAGCSTISYMENFSLSLAGNKYAMS